MYNFAVLITLCAFMASCVIMASCAFMTSYVCILITACMVLCVLWRCLPDLDVFFCNTVCLFDVANLFCFEIAQWVKHWPTDLAVPGSNPARGEIFSIVNGVPSHTAFHYHSPIVLI